MAHDTQDAIRRRFNRRFMFVLNVIFSSVASIVLFFAVFYHQLNWWPYGNQYIFAGYARPDLGYLGSIISGFLVVHGLWFLWREGRLNNRRFAFTAHITLALTSFALILFYLQSWYFLEWYKYIDYYTPISSIPSANLVNVVGNLLIAVVFLLIPHALWGIHRNLLEAALRHSHDDKPKLKREQVETVIGDDGEMADWVAQEMKAKRQS